MVGDTIMRQSPFSSQSMLGQSSAVKKHNLKHRPLRLFVIISAVGIFAFVLGGCSSTQDSSSSQSSHRATQLATPSSPTAFPTSPGTAILGANSGTFVAKYGQPNSRPINGVYEFSIYGNPHANDVTVATQNNKVIGILEDSPTDEGWSESEAIKSCLAFIPADSIYKAQMTFSDTQNNPTGMQRVYYSRSLAKQFPPGDFTDQQGNATTPGMFGIVLTYSTSGVAKFLGCATQVGLNPNLIPGIL
jgi:hypothetical protein